MNKKTAKRIVCEMAASMLYHALVREEWPHESDGKKAAYSPDDLKRLDSAILELHDELTRRGGIKSPGLQRYVNRRFGRNVG